MRGMQRARAQARRGMIDGVVSNARGEREGRSGYLGYFVDNAVVGWFGLV